MEQDISSISDGLVRFVGEPGPLDDALLDVARRGVLDWLGTSLAGSREPAGRLTGDLVAELGGAPHATVVGRDFRTSATNAALANGVAGHALDMDDTHLSSAVHATGSTLPAVLALAEMTGASGRETLTAYAVGFEVATYLGELVHPVHYEAPWHATAVFGTVGAAAAGCVILGLDANRTRNALGLAATQAAGLRSMFGTMGKPLHAGRAASSGLLAALLASRGFDAATDAFAGPRGFLLHLGARSDEDLAPIPSPERCTRILGNDFKLHACCHATHAAVDAALLTRAEPNFSADGIRRVDIFGSRTVPTVAADPDPQTGLAAKFSVAYAVLTALVDGHASRDRFTDEAVAASRVRHLLPSVTLHVVPEYDIRAARIEVQMLDGETISAATDAPRGSSQNPASWDDLATKFRSLADPILRKEATARVEDAVAGFPETSAATLMATLADVAAPRPEHRVEGTPVA